MTTCNHCPLAPDNNFTAVEARGNIYSKLFFIGEAPGSTDKRLGVTFVGRTGQFLQYYIEKYNLQNTCYLTNAVKCRPPRNRTPSEHELFMCQPRLIDELIKGNPRIIVLLGNTAINQFFGGQINNVSKLNNKFIIIGDKIIIPAYHPSYIMRDEKLYYLYDNLFHDIRILYKYLINPYI